MNVAMRAAYYRARARHFLKSSQQTSYPEAQRILRELAGEYRCRARRLELEELHPRPGKHLQADAQLFGRLPRNFKLQAH